MNYFRIARILFVFITVGFASCSSRSDEDIMKDVQQKMTAPAENNEMVFSNATASVKDGVVTLNGQCQGTNCADSLVARINDVDGVDEVVNNLSESKVPADLTLRTSVQSIISKYQGVQADVAEGVVVLRGTILRDQIQPLMNELSTLNATKIDNQLAIQ